MKTNTRRSPALGPGQWMKRMLLSISLQAESDLSHYGSCRSELHVHALRVRMKKLRALLILVESRVGSAVMEAMRRDMRTLRKAFSGSRDQQVITDLLAGLCESDHIRVPASPNGLPSKRSGDPPGPRRLRELRATAGALTRRLKSLRLRALTREDIAAAFAGHYAEVQRRHARCRKKPSPKRMHHWRTVVKDHYFQSLILLRDRRRCAPARKLGALLGRLQDFTMLNECFDEDLPDDLHRAIKRRTKELRLRAFREARRLLMPAPAKLEHRALKAGHC